jgi:hypothetical protein
VIKAIVVLLILMTGVAYAGQTAKTTGQCSPIATNNKGTITINCPGMSEEQSEQILKILNKILAEKLDYNEVMNKLDEILYEVTSKISQLEYREIATLDYKGDKDLGGYSVPGPLSGWTKDYIISKDSVKQIRTDEVAIAHYKELSDKYPKYPFSYWALAQVYRIRGDIIWRNYAREAVNILRITTAIPGHSSNHDQILSSLNEMLLASDIK